MIDQKEPTPTRERILETVDRLFYREGIRAVGVDAIAAELGISKKTLYRHFPSKDDLVVAYLKGRFRPLPAASDKPPAEQILKNFEWFARSLAMAEDYRGCAFLNALAELGSEEGEARKLAVAYKESRRLWYRALLSRLDVDDPDTLATQLALPERSPSNRRAIRSNWRRSCPRTSLSRARQTRPSTNLDVNATAPARGIF